MVCTKNETISIVFNKNVRTIHHIYSTRYSQSNFLQSLIKYKQTENVLSIGGPSLWNNKLQTDRKN